jgi:hypothetical protein
VEQLGDARRSFSSSGQEAAGDAHVALHARVLGVLRVHVVALLVGDHLQGELVVVAQEDAPLGAVGDGRRLGQDLLDGGRSWRAAMNMRGMSGKLKHMWHSSASPK